MRLQFIAFFNMIIAGFIIALIFDCYSFFLNRLKINVLIRDILDFIYSLLAFCIIFILLQLGNRLEIRFFIYPAIIVGSYIYIKTMSNFLNWSLNYLNQIINQAMKFILQQEG